MIGGNITADLQVNNSAGKNAIGEKVKSFETVKTLRGWLDYQSGDSRHATYKAKLQESTHVFVCDYTELISGITPENSRLMINGMHYDIVMIDNPMGLNTQLEFYLRYTGGQDSA